MQTTLDQLPATLQRLQTASGFDIERLQIEVSVLKSRLMAIDAQVQAEFDQTTQQIQDKNLPEAILERHQQTATSYRNKLQALLDELGTIEGSNDALIKDNAIKNCLEALDDARQPLKRPALDPHNLPFNMPSDQIRPPKEDNDALSKLFPNAKAGIDVAAINTNWLLTSPIAQLPFPMLMAAPPTTTDLAANEDAQITSEIEALAQSLNYDPLNIYNWVHDNIEFLPTYGSVQGSQLTLDLKRGNSADTASLLIALLRASGVHARYGYGTVEIPIEKVMNWVDTDDPAALKGALKGTLPFFVKNLS